MRTTVAMVVGLFLAVLLAAPVNAASNSGNRQKGTTVQPQHKLSKRNQAKLEVERLKALKRQAVKDATK